MNLGNQPPIHGFLYLGTNVHLNSHINHSQRQMALDALQTAKVINALEIFLDKHRPPEHIRHQVDIAYKIATKV